MRLQALTLLFASSLTVMAGAAVAPALPALLDHFHDVPNAAWLVKLVLSMPALFIALAAPFAGYIVDRWGRKRILIVATGLYVVAGSAGFVLDSLAAILVSRALLGIGVAGIMTSTTTLIADYFTGDRRNLLMGLQGTWMALGGTLYLSAGGLLGDVSWRAPFLIYATAILLIPLMMYALHEPSATKQEQANSATEPVGNLPIPIIAAAYFLGFSGMMMFYFLPVQLPFYLRELLGASATLAGFALAFLNLTNGVVSAFYRQVKMRLSHEAIFVVGLLVMGVGLGAVFFANSYPAILLAMAVFGAGFGLYFPNVTVWLVTNTPQPLRGRAVGGLTTSIFFGLFLSPLVSEFLGQQVGLEMAYAFAGSVLIGIAGVIAVFALARRVQHASRPT